VLLAGGTAWAYTSARGGDELACGSERDRYVLLAGDWEPHGADVAANDPRQPDVAWYAEYWRDVPPPPGAMASSESLVVSARRTGLDETGERLLEELGGSVLELTATEVDGRRGLIGTTGGRASASLLLLEVGSADTIELLSTEVGPDVLIEAAGQLRSVCHDEWVAAMQLEPEGERP
jgi:hypothetical protein